MFSNCETSVKLRGNRLDLTFISGRRYTLADHRQSTSLYICCCSFLGPFIPPFECSFRNKVDSQVTPSQFEIIERMDLPK